MVKLVGLKPLQRRVVHFDFPHRWRLEPHLRASGKCLRSSRALELRIEKFDHPLAERSNHANTWVAGALAPGDHTVVT